MGGLREYVNNCTEAEIVVFRNYMSKAFPDIVNSPQGVLPDEVIAMATPPPPPPYPSPATASQLPPVTILQEVHEGDVKMSESQMKTNIQAVIPFTNDVEIWGLCRIQNVEKFIVGYLEINMPGDLRPSTNDDKYVTFLMKTLFEDSYRNEHSLPKDNVDVSTAYPFVPKAIIQLIHNIGLAAVNINRDFDLEKYWKDVRRFFRDSEIHGHEILPTVPASEILDRARGVVAQEKQVILMQRNMTRSGYQDYLKELEELRASEETAGGTVAVQAAGEADKTMDTSHNTTHLHLRSRTVKASKTSEYMASTADGQTTRRRKVDEITEKQTEKTDTKRAKK